MVTEQKHSIKKNSGLFFVLFIFLPPGILLFSLVFFLFLLFLSFPSFSFFSFHLDFFFFHNPSFLSIVPLLFVVQWIDCLSLSLCFSVSCEDIHSLSLSLSVLSPLSHLIGTTTNDENQWSVKIMTVIITMMTKKCVLPGQHNTMRERERNKERERERKK